MIHIEQKIVYPFFTDRIYNTLVCRYVSFSTGMRNKEKKKMWFLCILIGCKSIRWMPWLEKAMKDVDSLR